MPFIPNTPESLIQRSDSKNPATTCKGITISGRPCRRDLVSFQASPIPKRAKNEVIAVLPAGEGDHDGAAVFFCWQHKFQAQTLGDTDTNGRQADVVLIEHRTSIDTLAERLGVLNIVDNNPERNSKRKKRYVRPASKWQDIEGSLIAVPRKNPGYNDRPSQIRPKRQGSSFLSLFCCIRTDNIDPVPPVRTNNFTKRPGMDSSRMPTSYSQQSTSYTPQRKNYHTSTRSPLPNRSSQPPVQTPHPCELSSQTESLLSLIPPSLSPQTTSQLLSELAKPISTADEPGYIYMFWLTDSATTTTTTTTTPKPEMTAAAAAASLLPNNSRRKSGQISPNGKNPTNPLSTSEEEASSEESILLKIGRASNVQRRMNEWTRQCGYTLSLIRFYPYHPPPSSPNGNGSGANGNNGPSTPKKHSSSFSPNNGTPHHSSSPATSTAQKVPHAHKIERLIHLELSDKRVKREKCASCGKEHREWFEVPSTREGVREVDAIVRRWVGWGMNKH